MVGFSFAQQLDSLIVTVKNPKGDAVVGVEKGFSKILVQSGIKDLSFDPAHTRVGSKHFIVNKTEIGYEIVFNVEKLEYEGQYSPLKLDIKHLEFYTKEFDLVVKPGRSYNLVIRPKKEIYEKETTIVLKVSPKGSHVFINGNEMTVERTDLTETMEEVRFKYNYTLAKKDGFHFVTWSVIPDDEDLFRPALSTDEEFKNYTGEWALGYLTPEVKYIEHEINLVPIDQSTSTWTYVIGGVLVGGISYLALKPNSGGTTVLPPEEQPLGDPPNLPTASKKRPIQIGFSVGL